MRKINYLVVHCSATLEGKRFEEKDIERMHAARFKAVGGKHIGYHVLIYLDGTIVKTKSVEFIGQHVSGHNADSIGICYIGGVTVTGKGKDTRTPAQKASLLKVLKELRNSYPNAAICGHYDFSPDTNRNGKVDSWEKIKECPCFDAKVEYKDI